MDEGPGINVECLEMNNKKQEGRFYVKRHA